MLLRVICGCAFLAGLTLTGCNQFDTRAKRRQAQTSAAPADYSASTKLQLHFTAASPLAHAPKPAQVAQLDFNVDGAPQPPLTMRLSDPDHPPTAVYSGAGYTVKITPQLGAAHITNPSAKEVLATCTYGITLLTDQGEQIGQFQVDSGGHLRLDGASPAAVFDVQMIGTRARTLYAVHRRAVRGTPTATFLDIEYRPGNVTVEHTASAADGWHYRFDFWDGTLWLHPADHMGDVEQQLLLQAAHEEKDRQDGTAYVPPPDKSDPPLAPDHKNTNH